METRKFLTKDNPSTDELSSSVIKTHMGILLEYREVYYLGDAVNEYTGMINKNVKEKHYTKNQMERNLKALNNAYRIAKCSATPAG